MADTPATPAWEIRPAKAEDLEAIQSVHRAAFSAEENEIIVSLVAAILEDITAQALETWRILPNSLARRDRSKFRSRIALPRSRLSRPASTACSTPCRNAAQKQDFSRCVFNLLEIGDLEVLRRDFDWSSLHPKEDLPPILFWVTEWLPKVFAAEVPYPVDILEWLLQAGADLM
eukprot:s2269_g4.t1